VDHRRSSHPIDMVGPMPEAPSSARITVMREGRYFVEAGATTGRRIKELAEIPPDFALYRRAQSGNERILDDGAVDVRNGDHFFARPAR
jgi:hypothetical protein